MNIYTVSFWKAAGERAVKTLAQALIAVLAVGQTSILTVDWQNAAAVAVTAAVLSILSSIASSGIGNTGPSLANEATVPPLATHAPIEFADVDPSELG